MKNYTLILLVLFLGFSSCTIEKMRYSRGYNIEWMGKKNHSVSSTKNKNPTIENKKEAEVLGKSEGSSIKNISENNTNEQPIENKNRIVSLLKSSKNLSKKKDFIFALHEKISFKKNQQKIFERKSIAKPEKISQKKQLKKQDKMEYIWKFFLLFAFIFLLGSIAIYAMLSKYFILDFTISFLIPTITCLVAALICYLLKV